MGTEISVGRSRAWRAIASILFAAALFGTTGTALAKGPGGVDPWAAAVLRLVVGGSLLALVAGRSLGAVLAQPRVLVVGAVGVVGYQTMFFAATERTGVAVAALATIGTSPLASRLIGRARRRPAPSHLWWVAATVLGAGLALQFVGGASRTVDGIGVAFAVVAGSMYAVYAEAGAVLIERGARSTAAMAGIFAGGAILGLPILPLTDLSWLGSGRGVVMLAYLGVITLTVAYVAFGWGLRHLAPSIVVMLTILEPAVASLLAVVLLDESLSPGAWIGAGLIFAGLPVAGLAADRRASTVEP